MEPTPAASPEPGRAPIPGEGAPVPGQQPGQLPPGLQPPPTFLQRMWLSKVSMALSAAMVINFMLIYNKIGKMLVPQTKENLTILADHGAFVRSLVHEGDWWRHFSTLITPSDAFELLICAWIFFSMAPMVEKLMGSLRFTALFVLAGAGGIAVAEVISPDTFRFGGPWTAVYSVLGAIPGIVLAETFSPWKTLKHPATRSTFFWIALCLLVAYISRYELPGGMQMRIDYHAQLSGMGLGLVLGFALTAITSRPPLGILLSFGSSCVVVGLIVASSLGMSTDAFTSTGATTGPTKTRDSDEPVLDDAETALSEEDALIQEVNEFLSAWGPLPYPMEQPLRTDAEIDQAEDYYTRISSVSLGTNGVIGELDPQRIRLLILLSRNKSAIDIARQYLDLEDTPEAEALAGAAFFAEGGSKLPVALDHLKNAIGGEGLAKEWPEAVFFMAVTLEHLHEDVLAQDTYLRFLRLVTDRNDDKSIQSHREPMIRRAREKTE